MELSRFQEEILITLNNADSLYEKEILLCLNCERSIKWTAVTQPSLNRTLKTMLDKNLIEVDRTEPENYNRKYYKISDFGLQSLFEMQDNRKRIAAFNFPPSEVSRLVDVMNDGKRTLNTNG